MKRTEILVGIDIGGTFIKGGILTVDGKVLEISKIETPVSRKIEDVCVIIKNFIVSLCNKTQTSIDNILGIGIACPGVIDVYNGIVIDSSNLAWYNEPLKEKMQNEFCCPILICNDADAALMAEMQFGEGMGCDDIILLTLGTGIGSAVVKHGQLIDGIELGHMVIAESDKKCACGRFGCFETFCSATALVANMKEELLCEQPKNKNLSITPKMIFESVKYNENSKKVINKYVQKLVLGIANSANIFQTKRVILGGGICIFLEQYIDEIKNKVNLEVDFPIELCVAKTQNDAGVLGAITYIKKFKKLR